MADLREISAAGARSDVYAVDEGLRAFMLRVYNYMAAGLIITGLAAYGVFDLATTTDATQAAVVLKNQVMLTEFGRLIFTSPLKWVVMLAPLGALFVIMGRMPNMSVQGAQLGFWVFAGLMGLSLSSIFLVYGAGSIARVFFITAGAFGALSLYGYTTHKNLSGMESFLYMGLFGVIIASVANWFIGSTVMQFAVSVIGVLVFSGLTAMHTQQTKEMYSADDTAVLTGQKAVMGALRLYLDFLNMFVMLLQLLGGNRQ